MKQLHAGPAKNDRKTYMIEKMRFIKPGVAVVHVRSLSTGPGSACGGCGNLGTYVMSKKSGKWLVVSFTNVGYELDRKGGEDGGHQAAVRRIRVRRPSAPDDINAEAKMAHANLESPRRAGFRLCVLQ